MQNFAIYNDSSSESCSLLGQIVTLLTSALITLTISSFSFIICLVLLSIAFRRPKRNLYEHFFWQLIVKLA